ncbi:hypothetical protein FRC12_013165, partial [Ceratobasidium sp. 428]
MVLLLQASISRLWGALDPAEDDQPLTYRRLREVVQFPRELLRYTMSKLAAAATTPLLHTLLDLNIFGLLARTLMFPLSCNYNDMNPTFQRSLNNILDDQLKAMEEFAKFLLKFDSVGFKALQDSHADWLRAAQHFEERCHMYDGDRFARTLIPRCLT